MNATITISSKKYTIVKREAFYGNASVERVTLEDAKGNTRTAMFYDGEFDVFETKPRTNNKFSRVNMRK